MAGLTGPGHDVEHPQLLTRLCVVPNRAAAREVVSAGDGGHHDAAAIHRLCRHALSGQRRIARRRPLQLTGFLIDGDDRRVAHAREQEALTGADAAIAAVAWM